MSFMNIQTASSGSDLEFIGRSGAFSRPAVLLPSSSVTESGGHPWSQFQEPFNGSTPLSETGSNGSSLRGAETMSDLPEFP